MTTTKRERPTGAPLTTADIDAMGRPAELTADQLALTHQTGSIGTGIVTSDITAAQNAPILHPPGTAAAASTVTNLVGAWQTKQIRALFNNRASRSGWAYLDGIGWRQFATTNDSAHVALGLLASAARVSGSNVVARDEADGQLHEIYLW